MKSVLSVLNASPRTGVAGLLLAASLCLAPGALAQSAPAAADQSRGATNAGDQYTGVAKPPADDAIVTSEDAPAPVPRKPSPAVPAAAAPAVPAAAPVENPDYGIVTSTNDTSRSSAGLPAAMPNSEAANSERDERGAHLISRPQNPDYGIVGMVPSPANQLAEGTDIRVRLLQALSTRRTQDGETFRAQVAKDVYKDGRVVIPMGSELRGRVVEVTQGHRLGAHATIRLRPDAVILPDGTAYHLYAQAISSGQPGTHTDQEGGIQPKAHVAKDLAEYGGGAGTGAVVGGVLGGPVGAGAGALVGAGLVTTHLLLQKPAQAQIEEGSELVFSLTEPMDLLPTRN